MVHRYLTQANDNVDHLNSLVQRINHMNQMLNTASDSPKHREELQKLRTDTRNLIQQIVVMLENKPSITEEAEHQRLVKKFGDIIAQFKQAVEVGKQKENNNFPARQSHYSAEGSSFASTTFARYNSIYRQPKDETI